MSAAEPEDAKMTRDQFAEGYAARSMLSLPEMVVFGFRFVPCRCGETGCDGWQAAIGRTDRNVTDEEWAEADAWADRYLGPTG